MSRSTSPCNPSRCGSQTRAPKTNRDTTKPRAYAIFGVNWLVAARGGASGSG